MAAHMFFRAFLADPFSSFSGAERIVMQATLYLVCLLVTVWFYYNKAAVDTRPLLSSTSAVADTESHPRHPLIPPDTP